MDLMEQIEYGWIDKDNKKYSIINENFANNYILQSPNEVIKNRIIILN